MSGRVWAGMGDTCPSQGPHPTGALTQGSNPKSIQRLSARTLTQAGLQGMLLLQIEHQDLAQPFQRVCQVTARGRATWQIWEAARKDVEAARKLCFLEPRFPREKRYMTTRPGLQLCFSNANKMML